MTQELNDLSSRILELLRSARVPMAGNEIAQRLGESNVDVFLALGRLEQTAEIVGRTVGIRSRTYYEIARR